MCEALVDDKQEVEEDVENLLERYCISHTVQLQMFVLSLFVILLQYYKL